MFISAWKQRNGKAACARNCRTGSACADNETLRAPLPWQMKINGGNEGEAMHRALNHVTWERHLLPTLAPAAQCTNAPLVGSPSSGAHGANSFGR